MEHRLFLSRKGFLVACAPRNDIDWNMKIVMAHKYNFLASGSERYSFGVTGLLNRHGHEVAPFSMQHPKNGPSPYERFFVSEVKADSADYGWQGLRAIGRMLYSFEARRKFRALHSYFRPDILHCQNIYHQISPSILEEARGLGLPAVMTLNDYHLVSPNYSIYSEGKIRELSREHPYLDTVRQKTIRGSFVLSAVSAFEGWLHRVLGLYGSIYRFIAPTKFVLEKCAEYGVPREKLVHIPYLFEMGGRTPAAPEPGGPVVYVGRLVEEKGVDVLLRAMKRLPDLKCRVVGDGPDRQRLEALAKDLKLKNVEFVGAKSGTELNIAVRDAVCVVVPSVWYEVFGLVALEAYALGKPVVASRIGGLEEAVDEGVTGLMFAPGNHEELAEKIRALAGDVALGARMGLAGRELARKNHDPESHYQKILDIYRRAIAEHV